MKLTVEIKDGRFIYSYKIGESEHNASRHLCADSLLAFAALMRYAHESFQHEGTKYRRELELEISGKTWIEENKEKAAEFLKTGKR